MHLDLIKNLDLFSYAKLTCIDKVSSGFLVLQFRCVKNLSRSHTLINMSYFPSLRLLLLLCIDKRR